MTDWSRQTIGELLVAYAAIMRELRARGTVRSTNNPVADLAEGLAELAFGIKLAGGSTKSYDGICSAGKRWQVKGRRLTAENPNTGLSVIRNLDEARFHYLLAIYFEEDFSVRSAYRVLERAARPEVWIELRAEADALADAERVDARLAAGERLPLAGRTLAVKDNIDVAGMPTTAACPAFSYQPERTAPAAGRLLDAGAVLLGKTNLDQFATGLVGTRSPYGAVRDMRRPQYVSGGSSSGSALAVALGAADIALGTDTAGSGRVPAAFQGIVGVKPTRGLIPATGVVPACRSLDCVSIFARTLAEAEAALALLAGPDSHDPLSRELPSDAPQAAPPSARVGVPDPSSLAELTPQARSAFAAAAARLRENGAQTGALDPEPFLEAGGLLYGGAFVAERHAALGAFVEAHREEVDPTVGAIIAAAAAPSAAQLFADRERLDRIAHRARRVFARLDAVLLPTTTAQPTIEAVSADPVGANAALGRFTNCANLLDLCAVSVPAGEADGGQFGVTVLAPAFADAPAADIAALLLGETRCAALEQGIEIFVAGAHLSGGPLNHELTERGARLVGGALTASAYRLYQLDGDPPKPGLVRVADGGAAIAGERWALSPSSGALRRR